MKYCPGGIFWFWEEGAARACCSCRVSVPQWDVRPGRSLSSQIPVPLGGCQRKYCGRVGAGLGQPGRAHGPALERSPCGPSIPPEARPGQSRCWTWASPCMTQHKTPVSGPGLLGDKGWECTDIVAAAASADPGPAPAVGRGIP